MTIVTVVPIPEPIRTPRKYRERVQALADKGYPWKAAEARAQYETLTTELEAATTLKEVKSLVIEALQQLHPGAKL